MTDFLNTDWAAMTLHDWIGTIITVSVFILMVGLYVIVLHPKNKESLESDSHRIPDADDSLDAENKNNG